EDEGAGDDVGPAHGLAAEVMAEQADAHAEHQPPRGRATEYAEDKGADAAEVALRRADRPAGAGDVKAGIDGDEGEDGERVGQGPEQRRDEVADQPSGLWRRGARIDRAGADLDEAEIDEEQAADDADPVPLLLQEGADPGEAEGGDQAVDRVGDGGAEPA